MLTVGKVVCKTGKSPVCIDKTFQILYIMDKKEIVVFIYHC